MRLQAKALLSEEAKLDPSQITIVECDEDPEGNAIRAELGRSALSHTSSHTCMHAYIHTFTYIHTYMRTYMRTYIHVCIHTYIQKCLH